MTELAIIILAAGKGTRMKSSLPKVLHPIAGVPMLHHVLFSAQELDPARIILVLGPSTRGVIENLPVLGREIEVVIQQNQLGTGDAVKATKELLSNFSGDVLILYGDVPLISSHTLEKLLSSRKSSSALSVLAFIPKNQEAYGRLVLDRDGDLQKIVESVDIDGSEKVSALCNSGIMALDGAHLFPILEKLDSKNAKKEYYLTDIVKVAVKSGLGTEYLLASQMNEVMGVNDRVQLAKVEQIIQHKLRQSAMENGATLLDPSTVWLSKDTKLGEDVTVGANVFFGPGVKVGNNVKIDSFCHLEGAYIGDGAIIGPFARLRPGTVIEGGAHIGNFVEIKKARVETGAKINHLSYIGDARVGSNANIGAGTITCNYDGFTKSLSDIGEGAFIGSNSALVAPVVIGDGAVVAAGSVITKDVAKDSLVIGRSKQKELSQAAARRRQKKTKG